MEAEETLKTSLGKNDQNSEILNGCFIFRFFLIGPRAHLNNTRIATYGFKQGVPDENRRFPPYIVQQDCQSPVCPLGKQKHSLLFLLLYLFA